MAKAKMTEQILHDRIRKTVLEFLKLNSKDPETINHSDIVTAIGILEIAKEYLLYIERKGR